MFRHTTHTVEYFQKYYGYSTTAHKMKSLKYISSFQLSFYGPWWKKCISCPFP